MLLPAGTIFWEIRCNIPSCQPQKLKTNHLYSVRMTHAPFIHVQHVSFLHASPPKPYMHLSSPPQMPHGPPTSFTILDHCNNTSTNHKAPHYTVFTSLLFHPLSQPQVSSLAPSVCVLPLI